jgi:thiamine biosynthesis lipoprotein
MGGMGLLLAACDEGAPLALEGEAMGMSWRAQIGGTGGAADLREEVEACFQRWEQATSLWREDSEVMRFNAAPAGEWMAVGKELWAAVRLAHEIAAETEGALDITIGPLVDLWGFGQGGGRGEVPSEEALERTLERCGWAYLEMDGAGRRLRKGRAGMRLNVNCVVEGLALEDLAARLRALGHGSFLLELGGEVLAAGESPRGGPWQVAVQAPEEANGEVFSMMPLRDGAVATSGTYRHRFKFEGKDYAHVIDPRTGRPVGHRVKSVSVMHPRCARADGYATALLVLGPERGRVVAERLGLRVIWIEALD